MRNNQDSERHLGSARLRVLLTLSRELLQTDEAGSSLGLLGRALVEMIRPDSALLLLRDGDRLDIVAFDSCGVAHPAGTDHPLYQTAIDLMSGVSLDADQKLYGNQQCEHVGTRTLAVAVPAHAAVATLAVAWDHDLKAAELAGCKPTLSCILELAAAALGKIEARSSLERLVGDQREQIANTSLAHTAELARRDWAATEMRMLSLTDVLTGLYNRRGFFLQADQIFKVSQRRRAKSAVIFADVDGLKHVNDELGHDAGDSLIRDAAIVFRQSFRQADVVSRLGGDEFVAYTLDDAQPEVILQRIRANLRAFNLMQERPYTVSLSAGVVQCDPGGGQTLTQYVHLADEQMYAQKRSRLH
jgi:diguanylate cyclase (GGDEF)-like protein